MCSGDAPVTETHLQTGVTGMVLRRLSEDDADTYHSQLLHNHLTRYGDYRELYPITLGSVVDELSRPGGQVATGGQLG